MKKVIAAVLTVAVMMVHRGVAQPLSSTMMPPDKVWLDNELVNLAIDSYFEATAGNYSSEWCQVYVLWFTRGYNYPYLRITNEKETKEEVLKAFCEIMGWRYDLLPTNEQWVWCVATAFLDGYMTSHR